MTVKDRSDRWGDAELARDDEFGCDVLSEVDVVVPEHPPQYAGAAECNPRTGFGRSLRGRRRCRSPRSGVKVRTGLRGQVLGQRIAQLPPARIGEGEQLLRK
jgi:hypothetical protein